MKIASSNNQYLEVFGNDWPTRDGTCIRDYIHIIDLAQGHIEALELLKKTESTEISINLGTGKGTSVLQLINSSILGRALPPGVSSGFAGESGQSSPSVGG